MCYRKTRSYENLERRILTGVGQFDIPQIGSMEKGVHFFLDDYQFMMPGKDCWQY